MIFLFRNLEIKLIIFIKYIVINIILKSIFIISQLKVFLIFSLFKQSS